MSKRREAAAGAAEMPWWLAEDVPCGSCSHWHAFGLEVRCVRCDDPVCLVCVVRVRGRQLCPACAPRRR